MYRGRIVALVGIKLLVLLPVIALPLSMAACTADEPLSAPTPLPSTTEDANSMAGATPTVSKPSRSDCPADSLCLYRRTGFGQPRARLALSDCNKRNYLSIWGWSARARSAAYTATTGSVTFYDDGPTPAADDDIKLFTMGPDNAAIEDLGIHSEKVDIFIPSC
jgi:hypothetical protein